jgi:transposase
MAEKHIVTLNSEELQVIENLLRKGKTAARKLKRANILRLADANYSDEEIKEATAASIATIERTRAKFVRGGLVWALSEEPRIGAPAKLDGKQEAFLVALACTTPPAGQVCWTMALLADRLLQLRVVDAPLSDETVRRTLKKTNSSRGCRNNGVFQKSVPNLSGEWRMC